MTLLEAGPKYLDKHNKYIQAFQKNAKSFFSKSHSPVPSVGFILLKHDPDENTVQ